MMDFIDLYLVNGYVSAARAPLIGYDFSEITGRLIQHHFRRQKLACDEMKAGAWLASSTNTCGSTGETGISYRSLPCRRLQRTP